MKSFSLFIFFFFIVGSQLFSQLGGDYTYAFLNQTNSARVASLGGKSVSLADGDLNMPFHNPSLLSSELDNHMVLNYVGYFSDIKYGYVSYAKTYDSIGNFAIGLHYMDYGEFQYADIFGERSGTFDAAEYAFNIIYSRRIDSFITVGANLKPIYTSFESYNSLGLALDIGIHYYHPVGFYLH